MFPGSLADADCIVIEGSNMAECHPVAYRWVTQAKLRGATVIHVDPRFTRTSAMADVYAPVRAGSDIVFLGALVKYVLDNHVDMLQGLEGRPRERWSERERFFHDYLTRYTNAPTLVGDDFQDTEDLGEVLAVCARSGWRAGRRRLGHAAVRRAGGAVGSAGRRRPTGAERATVRFPRPVIAAGAAAT
jgi:formate dehydrogenase major subunit